MKYNSLLAPFLARIMTLSRPHWHAVGRQSTDWRPTVDRLATDSRPQHRLSVRKYRPTVGRQSVDGSADYRPTVDRQGAKVHMIRPAFRTYSNVCAHDNHRLVFRIGPVRVSKGAQGANIQTDKARLWVWGARIRTSCRPFRRFFFFFFSPARASSACFRSDFAFTWT